MNTKKIILKTSLTILLGMTLPLTALAATAQSPKAQLSMSTSQWLQVISGQIKTANSSNGAAWKKYFQRDEAKEQPKGTQNLLSEVSGYQNLANNYVFNASIKMPATYKLPLAMYCQSGGDTSFCQNSNNANKAGTTFNNFNAQSIMDFNLQGTTNYQSDPSYITGLIDSSLNQPKLDSHISQLYSATAIYHALTQVFDAYQTGKLVYSKTKKGKQTLVPMPSQMQALHNAVKTPFKQKYFENLSKASAPQTLRLNNELLAESNAMKYKIIRQNQTRTILEANLLSKQIESNQLQKQTLLAINKLISLQQKKKH